MAAPRENDFNRLQLHYPTIFLKKKIILHNCHLFRIPFLPFPFPPFCPCTCRRAERIGSKCGVVYVYIYICMYIKSQHAGSHATSLGPWCAFPVVYVAKKKGSLDCLFFDYCARGAAASRGVGPAMRLLMKDLLKKEIIIIGIQLGILLKPHVA